MQKSNPLIYLVKIDGIVGSVDSWNKRRRHLTIVKGFPIDRLEKWVRLDIAYAVRARACNRKHPEAMISSWTSLFFLFN